MVQRVGADFDVDFDVEEDISGGGGGFAGRGRWCVAVRCGQSGWGQGGGNGRERTAERVVVRWMCGVDLKDRVSGRGAGRGASEVHGRLRW